MMLGIIIGTVAFLAIDLALTVWFVKKARKDSNFRNFVVSRFRFVVGDTRNLVEQQETVCCGECQNSEDDLNWETL